MNRFEAETTIARPAEEVWAYAADIERHTEWMTVTSAEILRGAGSEVGAHGRERLVFGPFRWEIEFEVVEAEPGRRLHWRAIDPHFDAYDVTLDLHPDGSSTTRATYRADLAFHGRWRLLAPLAALEGRSGIATELRRLKENVERRPIAQRAA